MKIFRCYIKELQGIDLPKQRKMLLSHLKKQHGLLESHIKEKLTARILVEDESTISSVYRNQGSGIPTLKNTNHKTSAILYWYIDTETRDNLELLLFETNPVDQVITADYSIPTLNKDVLVVADGEDRTPEVFQMIMSLSEEIYPLRRISSEIHEQLGVSISHMTVKNIIDRQQSRPQLKKFYKTPEFGKKQQKPLVL
jgi:hypothetical protein